MRPQRLRCGGGRKGHELRDQPDAHQAPGAHPPRLRLQTAAPTGERLLQEHQGVKRE